MTFATPQTTAQPNINPAALSTDVRFIAVAPWRLARTSL